MINKGQATSLSDVLVGLVVIGVIGLFVFLFMTRGKEVEVRVEENELIRRKITLTNALLSSDKLAYVSGSTVHRGVLDKEKLDNLASNPEIFSEINYPETGYSIKVVDLDENKEWLIGKKFDSALKSSVAIRYSEDDVHLGELSVEFNLKEPVKTIELDTCQKITEPGYYELKRNVNEDDLLGGEAFGSKNCFEIHSTGVTLDCNYRNIQGLGSHRGIGIVISSGNTVVKNCELEKFSTGIRIESSSNRIENNEIEQTNVGIILFRGDNEIIGNTIREFEGDFGRGIDIESKSNIIEGNRVFSALTNGIIVRKNDNELIANAVCGSSNNDIYVNDRKTASGSGNTCDKTYNYNDPSVTGCEKQCGEENSGACYQGDVEAKIREKEQEIQMGYPDFPDYLLWGIAKQESGASHCRDYGVVSGPLGSTGIMQVYPSTAASYCSDLDLTDWEENIECGKRVLLGKYNAFKNEDENYDPLDCGYSYADPWMRAVRGYSGWGCPIEWPSVKKYVCLVYDHARKENPSLPYPDCP